VQNLKVVLIVFIGLVHPKIKTLKIIVILRLSAALTFLPGWTPGVSASTIKPVKALLAGHLGSESVRASRKYL